MVGEEVGRVTRADRNTLTVATRLAFRAGDGLAFFDPGGNLQGTLVNAVSGPTVTVQSPKGIRVGTLLYRNHDHAFLAALKSARPQRRIPVAFMLRGYSDGVTLAARDGDGIQVERRLAGRPEPAREPDAALATIRRQLTKTGRSIYACSEVVVEGSPVPFLAVSVLNGLRRELLDALTTEREHRRPRISGGVVRNDAPYPHRTLTYLGNALNKKAEAFYRRHGVTATEPAAESGLDMRGRKVMATRYCIREQLGLCPREGSAEFNDEPLYLVDDQGNCLRLDFDCVRCETDIFLE
jgi:putative protease